MYILFFYVGLIYGWKVYLFGLLVEKIVIGYSGVDIVMDVECCWECDSFLFLWF